MLTTRFNIFVLCFRSLLYAFFSIFLVSGEIYGQFLYTKQNLSNNFFRHVVEDSASGNLYINNLNMMGVGTAAFSPTTAILKVSDNGLLLDSLAFNKRVLISDMMLSKDGNLNVFITTFDSIGSSMQNKASVLEFNSNLVLVRRIDLDSSSLKMLATGNMLRRGTDYVLSYQSQLGTQDSVIFVVLDSNFVVKNRKSLPGHLYDFKVHNDGYLLLGRDIIITSQSNLWAISLSESLQIGSIATLDSVGIQAQCSQKFGLFYASFISSLADSGFIITAQVPLVNHNCFGVTLRMVSSVFGNDFKVKKTTILTPYSGYNYYPDKIYSGHTDRSGNIYTMALSTRIYSNNFHVNDFSTKIELYNFNSSGDLNWSKYIGGDNYYLPVSLCATQDGGVIVGGLVYDTANPVIQNVGSGFLMKFDSNGELVLTGISEHKRNKFSVFPNPTAESVSISFAEMDRRKIRFYNSVGAKIHELNSEETNIKVDVSQWSAGLYLYEILGKEGISTGKIIKQ